MNAAALLLTLASLGGLAAWVWLVTAAFQNGEKNWGIILIVSIFVPVVGVVAPILFAIKFWAIARKPTFLLIGSLAATLVGVLMLVSQLKQAAEQFASTPELQRALREAQSGIQEASNESPESVPTSPRSEPPQASRPPVPPPPPSPAPRPPAPAPSSLAVAPPITTDYTAPEISPLGLDTLAVGDPSPNQMRAVRFRARNTSQQPVREANLSLTYLDARGHKLGQWTTVHTDSTNVVPGLATNEFTLQAFFVPQFTREVRAEVAFVRFADGTRWPPLDPTLAGPGASVR